jgi:sugar phosphate isomerase/epimerase
MAETTTNRIGSGLLSVTFRKLAVRQIVDLAAAAQLDAIEWGGDVHVPHGDVGAARATRRMCADRGLAVSAYGSYYRAGTAPNNPAIEAVLDSAAALGAPVVRVWAGTKGSAEVGQADRDLIIADLSRCCDLAAQRNLTIATEFHGGTLTDEIESCVTLLSAVDRPNLRTFWQPPVGMEPAVALAGLVRVEPWLSHLHVFHWWPTGADRKPLAEGSDRWPSYLAEAANDGLHRYASLEFVADDDPAQFRADAATLLGWLAEVNAAKPTG